MGRRRFREIIDRINTPRHYTLEFPVGKKEIVGYVNSLCDAGMKLCEITGEQAPVLVKCIIGTRERWVDIRILDQLASFEPKESDDKASTTTPVRP